MKPPGLRNLIFICLHTERLSEKFNRESYRQAGQAKVSGSGSTKGRNHGRRWDANGQDTFYRRTKPGDKKSRQEKRRVAGPESRHPLCILHAHNAEKRLWRQRPPSVWVNNTCKTCQSEYVGETQPAIGVRAKKHQKRYVLVRQLNRQCWNTFKTKWNHIQSIGRAWKRLIMKEELERGKWESLFLYSGGTSDQQGLRHWEKQSMEC